MLILGDASEERLGYEQQCGNVGRATQAYGLLPFTWLPTKASKFYAENDIFNGFQYRAAGEENVTLAEGAATSLVSFRGESQ